MQKAKSLLRRTLVNLYDEVNEIKVVADDSDVDSGNIAWENAVNFVWFEVIKEALKINRLELLVENARKDYDEDRDLIEAQNALTGRASELTQALQNLRLDRSKLGILDLVNCGRHAQSAEFIGLKAKITDKTRLLTCIIMDDYRQNPGSLAERFIYEYLMEKREVAEAVYFARDPQTFRIRSLLIDSKTKEGLNVKVNKYLEELEQLGVLSGYQVMAHIVKVDVDAAENVLHDVFSTCVVEFNRFAEKHNVINLLFIAYPYTVGTDTVSLKSHLNSVSKDEEMVRFYSDLGDVDVGQINHWFEEIGSAYHEGITKYLDEFMTVEVEQKVKNSFSRKNATTLYIMERVQAQVYRFAQSPAAQKPSSGDK